MTPPRAASRLWQFITMLRVFILLAFIAGAAVPGSAAPLTQRPIRIAVVDFGAGATGQRVAGQLAEIISSDIRITGTQDAAFQVIDRDQIRAAALGAGYRGSLNMTLQEARDLGSAIGCDFILSAMPGHCVGRRLT